MLLASCFLLITCSGCGDTSESSTASTEAATTAETVETAAQSMILLDKKVFLALLVSVIWIIVIPITHPLLRLLD